MATGWSKSDFPLAHGQRYNKSEARLDSNELKQKEDDMPENEETSSPDVPQVLNATESQLFESINRGFDAEKQKRWRELVAQRNAETLSDEHRDELIKLGDELESINIQRFKSIEKLATLRNVSFEAMCDQLEITAQ